MVNNHIFLKQMKMIQGSFVSFPIATSTEERSTLNKGIKKKTVIMHNFFIKIMARLLSYIAH